MSLHLINFYVFNIIISFYFPISFFSLEYFVSYNEINVGSVFISSVQYNPTRKIEKCIVMQFILLPQPSPEHESYVVVRFISLIAYVLYASSPCRS
jgi:hypothetical protein